MTFKSRKGARNLYTNKTILKSGTWLLTDNQRKKNNARKYTKLKISSGRGHFEVFQFFI